MASVRMTVLGCSGSVTGPGVAASGYLVTAPDTPPIVLDFGGGVLGELQRYVDPREAVVLLSHLHADHCLDLPGLLVWRRYGPESGPYVAAGTEGRGLLYGPPGTGYRIGAASAEIPGEIDDISDTIDLHTWVPGVETTIGAVTVRAERVLHPPDSYGMRLSLAGGGVLAYSGDTAMCEEVVDLARGADLFLCEASWTHDPANRPPGLHLSGTEAGRIAAEAEVGHLLLTHLAPWTDRDEIYAEARAEFDGPITVVAPHDTFVVGDAADADGADPARSSAPTAAVGG